MRKTRGIPFDKILERELKNKEVKFLFDEKRFYLQVARLVTELRAKSGLSQAQVAKRAGVTQPFVARLERGDHTRTPTFDTIYRILRALGYSLTISAEPERKA